MRKYNYQPISHHRHIRVLRLEQANSIDLPLQCNLTEGSLDNRKLRYEALSYVWGSPTGDIPLVCDGQVILITANCDRALRYLRLSKKPRYLWVDAVCINQESIPERNNQVKLMGEIYGRARCTLVWLGESDGVTKDLFSCLSLSFRLEKMHLSFVTRRLINRRWDSRVGKNLGDEEQQYIETLCTRSWFSRMWTLQELLLSKKIRVVCGRETISWAAFASELNEYLATRETILDRISLKCRGFFFRYHSWTNGDYHGPEIEWTSANLLSICLASQQCSDPKDKIYGLHAILARQGFKMSPPDYNKSAMEIYEECIVSHITQFRTLHIIECLASSFHPRKSPSLPSWVPDFNDQSVSHDADYSYLIPTFGPKIDIDLVRHRSLRSLPLRGIKVSVVDDQAQGEALSGSGFRSIHTDFDGPSILQWARYLREWVVFAAFSTWNDDSSPLEELAFVEPLSWLLTRDSMIRRPDSSTLLNSIRMVEMIIEPDNDEVNSDPSNEGNTKPEDPLDPDSRFIQLVGLERDRDPDCWKWIVDTMGAIRDQRLFTTSSNEMGRGPSNIQRGDIVVLFAGARMPMIIRPWNREFQLIGPAYIYGFFAEEEWKKRKSSEVETFIMK